MDHDHYEYSALAHRPPWHWPGSATVAVAVVLYLEHWELLPPADAVIDQRLARAHGAGFFPDTRGHSYREYGQRVGIFRVLESLDRHHIHATVAVNADACERYPNLIVECNRRGYEFVAHGSHATRMLSSAMTEDDEREHIRSALDAIEASTGARPRGWLGQDHGESTRTPGLLAAAGVNYTMDWPNDDQPYMLRTEPALVSVPSSPSLDDVQALWLGGLSHTRYPELVADALETLHREGARGARMCTLGIHPWMLGRPHRIRYLDEALSGLAQHPGIWQTFGTEIADHAREHLRAPRP